MYTLKDTLLQISDLSFGYGDKLILNSINLEIKDIVHSDFTAGQVVTLVGKSGSGKSTLFKLIAGMIEPSRGEVLIGVNKRKVCTGEVGMVLQNYPLLLHRTLTSNLKLVSKDTDKIDNYLAEFDLWDHKGKYPKELSGGQRQRAAIVQQLLCSDHFVLLDEPFSGLDPVAIDKLCGMITKAANLDESNTIIISSHILEPSMAISDTVWVLGKHPGLAEGGSTIVRVEDLASQGLSWSPTIRGNASFTRKVEEIRQLFYKL